MRLSKPCAVGLAMLFLHGAARAGEGGAGKRYPSEMRTYRDEASGREVTALTSSPSADDKIYQTHPSWTADGRHIVFISDRSGSEQLFAVAEAGGEIVQLTDAAGLNARQICLSRKRNALITMVKREIARLDLDPLLEPAAGNGAAAGLEIIGEIPAGAALSGGISWDAAEDAIYIGLERPERPEERRWSIGRLDLESGKVSEILAAGFRIGHVQANPLVPGLLMYCHETGGDAPQRMYVARADGSLDRPFYRETADEWVTHEVWWDASRALFTIWPHDEAARARPHGIASVDIDGKSGVLGRFAYWHVGAAPASRLAAADTMEGEIFRVDLESGARALLTSGHRPGRRGPHPHVSLSPGGKKALFASNRAGNADIYLVELADPSGK